MCEAEQHPAIMERLHWVKVEMEIVEGKDKLCAVMDGVKLAVNEYGLNG